MTYEEGLGVLSVVMLLMFIGIFAWAFHPANKKDFDEAARTPLDDDAPGARATKEQGEP